MTETQRWWKEIKMEWRNFKADIAPHLEELRKGWAEIWEPIKREFKGGR